MIMRNDAFIISLGGSLIVPASGIDWRFLRKFRQLILGRIKAGDRFVIITGGGAVCREYNAAAVKAARVTALSLDWLGIQTTRLNAYLLLAVFGARAYPGIITDPSARVKTRKKIIIGGGWLPGSSSDFVAVTAAREYGAKQIINLSNVDHVYDKDPHKFRNAKKLTRATWAEFRRTMDKKWQPGLNTPFDPVASALAEKFGLRAVIVNGRKFKNLKNLLTGKNFTGTTIG